MTATSEATPAPVEVVIVDAGTGDPVTPPDVGTELLETAFGGVTQLIIFLGGIFGLKKILGNKFALYALTALYLITRSTPRKDDDVLFETLRGASGIDQTSIDAILAIIGASKATAQTTTTLTQTITPVTTTTTANIQGENNGL